MRNSTIAIWILLATFVCSGQNAGKDGPGIKTGISLKWIDEQEGEENYLSMRIKPPMVFSREHTDQLIAGLKTVLPEDFTQQQA